MITCITLSSKGVESVTHPNDGLTHDEAMCILAARWAEDDKEIASYLPDDHSESCPFCHSRSCEGDCGLDEA